MLGIAQRHVFLPEVVVEIQVQQGAVHIEEDAVDIVPGNHRQPVRKVMNGNGSKLVGGNCR